MKTLTRQIAESLWGPTLIAQMDAQFEQSIALHGRTVTQRYSHARGQLVLSASTLFDCHLNRGNRTILRFHCDKKYWLNAMILLATAEDSLCRISKREGILCLAYNR